MTIKERLQLAYITGRESASSQIADHLSTVAIAMEEQDPPGSAVMKYAAEFANSLCGSTPEYEEE